jgi:ferredoxin
LLTAIAVATLAAMAWGSVERFPPPELPADHPLPQPTTPAPRGGDLALLDVAVLLATLALASVFAVVLRNRKLMLATMLFSLAYFGFYRRGCVCPIGAIGNVSWALAGGYVLPAVVLVFFLAPLATALITGRTFCASVCPLGAMQDVVALKPVKVPFWLEQILGLMAYLYLALAVLLAWTGSGFAICQYDPFVSFFRLSGAWNMLAIGVALLAIGVFFARPYCRLFCPYGVLLRLLSRVSWKRVRITPAECIRCRLCEDACPYGAIRPPTDTRPTDRRRGKLILACLLALAPVLTAAGALGARRLSGVLWQANPTVRLAQRVAAERAGEFSDTTKASEAFYRSSGNFEALMAQARQKQVDLADGATWLGAFMGLVIALKLIGLHTRRRRQDFEADPAACLACGRCYNYCPVHRAHRTGDFATLEKLKAATSKT